MNIFVLVFLPGRHLSEWKKREKGGHLLNTKVRLFLDVPQILWELYILVL